MDKSDVNVSTLSPEKSKGKEGSKGMAGDLADKDENSFEKNDQSIDIVNIKDLESDDVPINQRLAPRIAKRLKNRKCQVIESSSTPSKSLRKRASVGPTKRWSKVVTPVSKKKSLKRNEVSSKPTTRTCILAELKDTFKTLDETIKSYTERKSKIEILIKALSEEEGNLKGDGTSE
ncbi:hypothetical protein KIW84_040706 [Lathyrus oleraceus]|uniref:Uncharacterized protein n=1 Tax=Pisum sativum TaxID=3888 RepID=A0A9D4X6Q7_PEA|nr:hypothetical protein KIW84_040706 [Pisum sativum]